MQYAASGSSPADTTGCAVVGRRERPRELTRPQRMLCALGLTRPDPAQLRYQSESDWFAAARFSLRAQDPYTKGVHKSSR